MTKKKLPIIGTIILSFKELQEMLQEIDLIDMV